jgi:putative salt-induced outer membrane protein YdiY
VGQYFYFQGGENMKINMWIVVSVIMYVMLNFTAASADVVFLSNGDRISGKIMSMEGGQLLIKTDYAGEVSIVWEEVEDIVSDEKIKLVLDDGTVLEGQPLPGKAGTVSVQTEAGEESSAFNLSDIKTINPKVEPDVKYKARANAAILIERGNTHEDETALDASFQARTKKSRLRLYGEFNREKEKDTVTTRDWMTLANYDYFFKEKWFGYLLSKFENDDFADLDLRTTVGGGLGHQFFESDTLELSLQAGPAYVDENYIEANDDDFMAGQWFLNYEQSFYENLFQLFHVSDGYMSVEDSDNWIFNTRQGIRVPLYKGITLTLQYIYDFENIPSPDATTDYESELSLLLGYEFKN